MNLQPFWQAVTTARHYLDWHDTPSHPLTWLPIWQLPQAESITPRAFLVKPSPAFFFLFFDVKKENFLPFYFGLDDMAYISASCHNRCSFHSARIKQLLQVVSTLVSNKCCGRCYFWRREKKPQRTEWFTTFLHDFVSTKSQRVVEV